ncbi:hypothetical protein L7F22_040096 [Adiantum nelumboides]|nr:hypothetical protein [Adiantum nelumboides]
MSAVLAKPQVKDFFKTLAKVKEKGQEQRKEHDVNAHAATAEGEPSKKPWEEDIPELSSPSYSPPTSFSYSSDSSSSFNPRRRRKKKSVDKAEVNGSLEYQTDGDEEHAEKQVSIAPVKEAMAFSSKTEETSNRSKSLRRAKSRSTSTAEDEFVRQVIDTM